MIGVLTKKLVKNVDIVNRSISKMYGWYQGRVGWRGRTNILNITLRKGFKGNFIISEPVYIVLYGTRNKKKPVYFLLHFVCGVGFFLFFSMLNRKENQKTIRANSIIFVSHHYFFIKLICKNCMQQCNALTIIIYTHTHL